MNRKTLVRCGALLLIPIVLVTGCGSSVTTPPPTTTTTPPPTTTVTTTPFEIRKVFVSGIDSFSQHFMDRNIVGINLDIVGNDTAPMTGTTVTVQMTRPDGITEISEVTTYESGHATVEFTIFDFGTYTITVLDITGENMEYAPENNVESSVTVEVEPPREE